MRNKQGCDYPLSVFFCNSCTALPQLNTSNKHPMIDYRIRLSVYSLNVDYSFVDCCCATFEYILFIRGHLKLMNIYEYN